MLVHVCSQFPQKTHFTFLPQAPPQSGESGSPDVWPRPFISERKRGKKKKEKKVRHLLVYGGGGGVRPPGIPAGSPQVDGEGRGEDDAQHHQERQPGLQKPRTAGIRERGRVMFP